jgi:hypothetical protein
VTGTRRVARMECWFMAPAPVANLVAHTPRLALLIAAEGGISRHTSTFARHAK